MRTLTISPYLTVTFGIKPKEQVPQVVLTHSPREEGFGVSGILFESVHDFPKNIWNELAGMNRSHIPARNFTA